MAIEIDLKVFDELLKIQKERKRTMDELSLTLGYDISFSEDEVMKFALEAYQEHLEKQINTEVKKWMKSLY